MDEAIKIMGHTIYFRLYKNPEFKDQFEKKIKPHLLADYFQFLETTKKETTKKYDYESFDPDFSNERGMGLISIDTKADEEFLNYILKFWNTIATKYFFEECVLIDIHEYKDELNLYFLYKGNIEYLSSFNDSTEHMEILECIDKIIERYNKPFQYEFKEISVLNPSNIIKLDDNPKGVVFSPNEQNFACILFNGEIIVWDFHTRKILQRFIAHNRRADAITISSDSKYILSSSWDKTLKIWDLLSGNLKTTIQMDTFIHFIKTTPSNKFILTAMDNGSIVIWELSTGKKIRTLEGHHGMAISVSVTSNEKYIVSSAYDGTIKIWELKSGTLIRTISGHIKWVHSTISRNGKFVVGGYSDGLLKIWEFETGDLIKEILGHKKLITKIQFMHNDRFFATSSSDFTLKIWDINDGNCIQILEGHSEEVSDFAITLNDNFIISGAHDKSIIIWKLK